MSVNLTKSPIWIGVIVVGLVAATVLVAGYGDKPEVNSQATSVQDKCADCPQGGTPQCGKAATEAGCSGSTCAASKEPECKESSGCCGKKTGCSATEVQTGCSGGGGCSVEAI